MKIALNWLNDFIDLSKIEVPNGNTKENLAKYLADRLSSVTAKAIAKVAVTATNTNMINLFFLIGLVCLMLS